MRVQPFVAIRVRNYSPRTEGAYWHGIKKFILFHSKRHPSEMGEPEITAFLSHLAVDRKVTAPTQDQALRGLLFLYKEVLKRPLEWMDNIQRAKKPSRWPLVFTKEEAQSILRNLECEYDDDLHSRAQQNWERRAQPSRSA